MAINYCQKCGINETITKSGYCSHCRKLLRLNPNKLGEIQDVPDGAIVMNGELLSWSDRESDMAHELHLKEYPESKIENPVDLF